MTKSQWKLPMTKSEQLERERLRDRKRDRSHRKRNQKRDASATHARKAATEQKRADAWAEEDERKPLTAAEHRAQMQAEWQESRAEIDRLRADHAYHLKLSRRPDARP